MSSEGINPELAKQAAKLLNTPCMPLNVCGQSLYEIHLGLYGGV